MEYNGKNILEDTGFTGTVYPVQDFIVPVKMDASLCKTTTQPKGGSLPSIGNLYDQMTQLSESLLSFFQRRLGSYVIIVNEFILGNINVISCRSAKMPTQVYSMRLTLRIALLMLFFCRVQNFYYSYSNQLIKYLYCSILNLLHLQIQLKGQVY